MNFLNALRLRLGAAAPQRVGPYQHADERPLEDEGQGRDPRRLFLVIGLGALSWVATYVGMLELIESNLGDLPFIHKIIIGFSVAMLMTMIIWLLDKMFSPTDAFTKACYIAGYLFLSVISVGFGFGFYWKVLESRGEASRSAESAITQVQTALFAASTRLEQLQSTLDQLTTVSSEKAVVERDSGKSCPNSGPGDGPRRKMREEDAGRFKFASDFVKGRIGTVKSDMAALDGDLQKIVKDDRSVIDARTGNRNEFLRGISRKLDLTVTGFNAFRSDPQLKQIRIDLADRAEKTTITGAKGVVISCPDAQLQMALRGVVRAIDQLPELSKPQIAAVEGSEATIEAFRRLTTTFFGLLTFKLPPSADELRELQRKAIQSVEGSGQAGAPGAVMRPAFAEQAAGLAKRDYVPLAVAIFVDLCLLLVSIGRPVNQFMGLERSMREAEDGPVYPILARFHDIHADADAIRHFEVFRDVIFDLNGQYHVAVPLNIPRAPTTTRICSARPIAWELVLRARRQGHPVTAHELPAGAGGAAAAQASRQQVRGVLRQQASRPLQARLGGREVRVVRDRPLRQARVQGLPLQEGRLAGADPGRRDGRGANRRARATCARPATIPRVLPASCGRMAMAGPPRCSCRRKPGTVPEPTAITTRMRPSAATSGAMRNRNWRQTAQRTIRPSTAKSSMGDQRLRVAVAQEPVDRQHPEPGAGRRRAALRARAGAHRRRLAHAGLTAARVGPPAAWPPESPPRGARAAQAGARHRAREDRQQVRALPQRRLKSIPLRYPIERRPRPIARRRSIII